MDDRKTCTLLTDCITKQEMNSYSRLTIGEIQNMTNSLVSEIDYQYTLKYQINAFLMNLILKTQGAIFTNSDITRRLELSSKKYLSMIHYRIMDDIIESNVRLNKCYSLEIAKNEVICREKDNNKRHVDSIKQKISDVEELEMLNTFLEK